MFYAILSDRANAPPKTPEDLAAEKVRADLEKMRSAMIRCENQTESQLADPDGFDAESFGSWLAQDASEDRYVFSFNARARNAFGALIWAKFECTVVFDGKYWTASVKQL